MIYYVVPHQSTEFCPTVQHTWTWQTGYHTFLGFLQQEVIREPPLPNLLKDEEHQCVIIDVSIFVSFISIPCPHLSFFLFSFRFLFCMYPSLILLEYLVFHSSSYWVPHLFIEFLLLYALLLTFLCFLLFNFVVNSYARHWQLCEDTRKLQKSLTSL